MPKLKTHSGAKKRFNLTKSGMVKRAKATSSPRRIPSVLVVRVYLYGKIITSVY